MSKCVNLTSVEICEAADPKMPTVSTDYIWSIILDCIGVKQSKKQVLSFTVRKGELMCVKRNLIYMLITVLKLIKVCRVNENCM